MTDKTNYAQSLMHMIKGNLGTGILAMPASFAHTGLVNGVVGLPILCLISAYCVHLLVKSSQKLKQSGQGDDFQYANLAKYSFKRGPSWMSVSSGVMGRMVDGILLVAQMGVCCVYLVFVTENIVAIFHTYKVIVPKSYVFAALFPATLLLSFVKTLSRLAYASAFANFLQATGITLILHYLIKDIDTVVMAERDLFRPLDEVALGFGSAMFAFEGISVVLPLYTRMKDSNRMSGLFGVINLSYGVLLVLYFVMGLFGFLKFGSRAKDSITLNLPPEPLYDGVRAMFALSVFFTYPLQFYVPNEIIWSWVKTHWLSSSVSEYEAAGILANGSTFSAIGFGTEKQLVNQPIIQGHHHHHRHVEQNHRSLETCKGVDNIIVQPTRPISIIANTATKDNETQYSGSETDSRSYISFQNDHQARLVRYEYCCRAMLVIFTFLLAISVPKLNLLMDFIGSISGTALSLIIPAIIHIAAFWDESKGYSKASLIIVDTSIILFGLAAGISGSIFSVASIIDSFRAH